ncbi:MAG TPA: hypothetical protein VMP01_19730 [Pirellulaceae bacterium]|nr:hypothetical protein [Pirellulaceae bacterium]
MIFLEHRRTSRKEGVLLLVRFGSTVAIMIGGATFMWWLDRSFFLVFYILFCVVCVLFLAVGVWAAVDHMRREGEYLIRIDESKIECVVPDPWGESFKLPIQDIVKVEIDRSDSDRTRWYLHDKAGRRYELTINYDNPIVDIVELLERLNPAIEEVYTH